MKRLIGMTMAVAVGLALVAAPAPGPAAGTEDLDKTALMLHGVTAVYSSLALTMNAYRAGLLTAEETTAAVARDEQFLAVLARCGAKLERDAGPEEYDQVSFAKDYRQVCNYLQLALDSFKTFLEEGNELDRKLFDRYLANAEKAVSRMLKGLSGG